MGRNNSDFGKASGLGCVACGDELPNGPAHSTMHDNYSNVTHHVDKGGKRLFSERHDTAYVFPEGNVEASPAGKHCSHCNELAESAERGGSQWREYAQERQESLQPDSFNDV